MEKFYNQTSGTFSDQQLRLQ